MVIYNNEIITTWDPIVNGIEALSHIFTQYYKYVYIYTYTNTCPFFVTISAQQIFDTINIKSNFSDVEAY